MASHQMQVKKMKEKMPQQSTKDVPKVFKGLYESFFKGVPKKDLPVNLTELRFPILLDCYTSTPKTTNYDSLETDIGPSLNLAFNRTPLDVAELFYLKETRQFAPEIGTLAICKGFNDNDKLDKLLDFIGIQKIFSLNINSKVNVKRIIEKYDVRRLNMANLKSLSFLKSPAMQNIHHLDLSFYDLRRPEEIQQFLENNICSHIKFAGFGMPFSVVFTLVEKWFHKKHDFSSIVIEVFDINLETVVKQLEDKKIAVEKVEEALCRIRRDDMQKVLERKKAPCLLGKDNIIVLKRKDKAILRIEIADKICRTATLQNMDDYDVEEEEVKEESDFSI